LRVYFVNLSAFEERLIISEFYDVSNQIDYRIDDQVTNANFRNLRDLCITRPIGFVFPIEVG
jgi:methionyl-tRNA synthetase